MKWRVKAFTIVELVVVMILTAIVISIAYAGYALVGKSLANYMGSSKVLNEYLMLTRTLDRDFDRATTAKDSSGNVVMLKAGNDGTVVYAFGEEAIVRTAGTVADSFAIGARSLVFVHQDDSPGLVTAIGFDVMVGREAIHVSCAKVYAAKELIEP